MLWHDICEYFQCLAEADQVLFFDAVESVDEFSSIADIMSEPRTIDPRLADLQARLIRVCQLKAAVRNKKVTSNIATLLSFCQVNA